MNIRSDTTYKNLPTNTHGYGLNTGLSVIAADVALLDVDDRPVDIRLLATVARLSRPTTHYTQALMDFSSEL